MKFVDPIRGIGPEKFPHRPRVGAVEVNGAAPFAGIFFGKVILGKTLEIISVRPEVVVNYIEDDHQSEFVRAVDKKTRFARGPVKPARREKIHSVVAPAKFSGHLR